MKTLPRRRRHPLAGFVIVVLGLLVTGLVYTALDPGRPAQAAAGSSLAIDEGRALFLKGCSSCHGLNAEGTGQGPSLIGVGAAAVNFQVGTGRMPLAQPGAQAERKPPVYTQAETDQLAAFVASTGPGPGVPDASQLDYRDGDVASGGELFRTNCAMCHNFAAKGGALTQGKYAPSLSGTSARHIYEAMITGPQSMPVFSDSILNPQEKKDIIAWVKNVNAEPTPGGAGLGKLGPVTEGLLLWTLGIGSLIGVAVWLGAKSS